MAPKGILLSDRSLIEISGPDSFQLLQGLITNDINNVRKNIVFSGFLSPQGKILYDFFICLFQGKLYIDIPTHVSSEFIQKLTFYKLRSDVTLTDCTEDYAAIAIIGSSEEQLSNEYSYIPRDPRLHDMGLRGIMKCDYFDETIKQFHLLPGTMSDYHKHRINLSVPEGGHDYSYHDTFPHEACYDFLNGVDFKKGCYIGQEIVSRMQHRGTARKRIVHVHSEKTLPDTGNEIVSNDYTLGILGSSIDCEGLALVRLDRLQKALKNSEKIFCSGEVVSLTMPTWANYGTD